jgi:hypothetical protein
MSVVLPKINIHPIILPQKLYTDRFRNANAYIEMNPSMNIDVSGNVKILVRMVNYKKYCNKQFTLYENYSNSAYVILLGKIEDNKMLDLDNFIVKDVAYNYNIPTYATYWKGMEDIRFIDSNSILVIVPECNKHGNPSIFRAKIENNIIDSFTECKPNNIEKNWMPYINMDGNPYVIYSVYPFLIKNIESDTFTEISISAEKGILLKGYNGSTNGIQYNNKHLFLIHINKEKSYHRWLLVDLINSDIYTSAEFVFFPHSYIEFPISLCDFNNRLFISVGINDDKAFIIETTFDEVIKSLSI